MPLGILSAEEAKSELERFGICGRFEIEAGIESEDKLEDNSESDKSDARSSENNVISFSEIKHGRGNKEETPESVRAFIASEAICGADVDSLSENFNISKSSISAYKKGATSTASYNSPNAQLLESNRSAINHIIGPAQSRIIKAIQSITDEKLFESKARDAASIAASLSSVIKNISPDSDSGQKTQINIFAPRKHEEEDYEIIRVDS